MHTWQLLLYLAMYLIFSQHVESDVRPIAVTNAIAKIAEKFVSSYFNDFSDDYTDVNQFGSVHGRSTTHALLKVMHE